MRRCAFHESHRRDERVEHTRILANARRATQTLVQHVRILARQIVRMRDAEQAKVLGE